MEEDVKEDTESNGCADNPYGRISIVPISLVPLVDSMLGGRSVKMVASAHEEIFLPDHRLLLGRHCRVVVPRRGVRGLP